MVSFDLRFKLHVAEILISNLMQNTLLSLESNLNVKYWIWIKQLVIKRTKLYETYTSTLLKSNHLIDLRMKF